MKKILIVITLFMFLIVAALLSVPFWLDVNEYKQEIVKLINDKTGFKVKIDGNITARAVPDISLVIDKVSVASSLDESKNLFSSDQLVVNVKLKPIFQKRLEIASLQLIKPDINLVLDKSGQANWEQKKQQDLSQPKDSPSIEKDEVTEVDYSVGKKSIDVSQNFSLNELVIKDGNFVYVDKKTKQNINISDFNVTTSVKKGVNDFLVSGKLNVFEQESKGVFSVSGKYLINGLIYEISEADIKLDKIESKVKVEANLSYARPSINASIYSNKINIDDYKLASVAKDEVTNESSSEKTEKVEQTSAGRKWSTEEFDVSVLNKMDVNFNFKADGIKFGEFEIGETAFNTYLKNGRLTLNYKDVALYGGKITGETIIDGATGLPTIKSEFDINSIDVNDILELAGKKDVFDGKANLVGNVYSVGNSEKTLINKLNGKVALSVVDGYFEGVDLFSMIKNKPSAFNIGTTKHKTRFEQITADINIKDGVLLNDNFVLKSDILNFEGSGQVDLPKQSIAYKLTPKYSQDFEKNDEIKPRIPIMISGNLYNPVFRLEVKTLVQDLINNPESGKNLVNQLKRDFKDIKGNIGSEEGIQGLKNLFQ